MKNRIYYSILTCLLMFSFATFATVHQVSVSGITFSPSVLNIVAGDTVVFSNQGGFHNVKADDGSFRCAINCEISPNDGNGSPSATKWAAQITFNSVGTFNYFCEIHGGAGGSGMSGTIIVSAPTESTQITVISNDFAPNDVNILIGGYAHFVLVSGTHNVRADNDSFECSQGCLGSGKNLTSEPSSSPWDIYVQFNTLGDIQYFCELHGGIGGIGMSGVIHVVDADPIFQNGFENSTPQ